MPWGANRLHNPSALVALKVAVRVDESSPSGLSWRDDYTSRKVTPGTPAGSFDARLGQWQISVKGYPLYARHAVWMLANDQPIPQGMDIQAADGNMSNMRASNLVVATKAEVRRPGTGRLNAALTDSAKARAGMPHAIGFTDTPYGCVLSLHIRREAYPVFIFRSRTAALFGGYAVSMACGYSDDVPIPEAALRAADAQVIRERVATLYTPLTGKLTPSQERVKAGVKAMLKDERIKQMEARNGEVTAVAP